MKSYRHRRHHHNRLKPTRPTNVQVLGYERNWGRCTYVWVCITLYTWVPDYISSLPIVIVIIFIIVIILTAPFINISSGHISIHMHFMYCSLNCKIQTDKKRVGVYLHMHIQRVPFNYKMFMRASWDGNLNIICTKKNRVLSIRSICEKCGTIYIWWIIIIISSIVTREITILVSLKNTQTELEIEKVFVVLFMNYASHMCAISVIIFAL